jgi:rare lipoprotein A
MAAPSPRNIALLAWLFLAPVVGCSSATHRVRPEGLGPEVGTASFYAHRFHGRKTASGEVYDEESLTAAHRTAAFGTRVRVINLSNGRSVILRVNDRGPWARERVIDVSYAAAQKLGFVREGLARVRLEVLAEKD